MGRSVRPWTQGEPGGEWGKTLLHDFGVPVWRLSWSVMAGRCTLTLSKPVLKAPSVSALKRHPDESLSNFAFSFDLRRYMMGNILAVSDANNLVTVWKESVDGKWDQISATE
jgi:protein transport protein SEC13